MTAHSGIDLKSWLLLLFLAALWSGSFIFNEVALVELDAFTIVLARVGIGAAVIWVYLLARGHRMPFEARLWAGFALIGLINNAVPFTLIVWGQGSILAGEAAILNATTPIFAALLGHFSGALDERLTLHRAVGIGLGVLGVTFMVGVEAGTFGAGALWGYGAAIASSVSYAFAAHAARRFASDVPGPVAATGMLTAGTLWMVPVVALFGGPFPTSLGFPTLGALFGLGALCSALAYIVYFAILHRAGPTNLLLTTMLIPPMALILGIALLGERFGVNDLTGLAFIILGLALIDGRLLQRLRRPTRQAATPPPESPS